MARTSASARWHFRLHSLHTRTGAVYLMTAWGRHALEWKGEGWGLVGRGLVLEARERAAVTRAIAAEHEATVAAVVPSHEQAEVSPGTEG